MLSRPQGKLAFAELRDASGSVQLFALAAVTRALRRVRQAQPGRLDRGAGRGGADQARRALGEGGRVGAAGRGAAQLRRQVARRERRRDALPPARGRPVGERAHPAAASAAQRRDPPHARASVGAGLRGGRDAAAAPDHGGRHGAPLRDAPQRVRRRLLPPRRSRALLEAPRGRRLRQGVRDRAHVPQRGHLAASQPRVHDARAVPGLCRLHRHHGRLRGAGGRPGSGCARHDQADLRRTGVSTSPRRGAAPPWPSSWRRPPG